MKALTSNSRFFRKRSAVTLVGALMSVVMIAGCGNSANESTATSTTKTSAADPIHILLSHSEFAYAKQAKEDDIYKKELNRLSGFNVKYDFLGHSDYAQQLSLRFASGDLADMIRTDSIVSTIHSGAVDQGVFLELGPLIDKYAPTLKKKIPAEFWKSPRISKDGKIYGIPVTRGVPADRSIFIRQDWLDKLKMDAPKTLEEYLAFFEAVKKEDMNGNGDPNDEYGLGMFNNIIWTDIFTPAFGVHTNKWSLKNGQLTPDIIDPRMKEAIAFYKQLYDKGYINPNLFVKKEDEQNASIAKGEVGVWGAAVYQYLAGYGKDNAQKTFLNQPSASVSMIAPPQGPRGDKGMALQSDEIYYVWVIPAKAKNPENIIKYLEWAYSSPDADQFFAYGIKGQNYTEENGQIKYDINQPVNVEKNAFQMYQVSLNPREIGFAAPLVLKALPESEKIAKGYATSKGSLIPNEAKYMPRLESLASHPELNIGAAQGTLFLDMFAKVLTGKEPLDSAFDNFVVEWKKRGGDASIKEATDWYNKFNSK
ncbi:extracellular solute-binding protein [Paenibacillus qinlingensis]|uniref:extracellular solute-binding protein n=1 Tax=Paenibacillus qinlingensis TaxID=1837343 RepID=UPI0015655737|nr:extracellular solute-binding protein [Paenibacillus qinlingensis]NQX62980.1 extracellular solute-binding protein [Paenibacillus qinlingensis]